MFRSDGDKPDIILQAVGLHYRTLIIKDVAEELHLDWSNVKTLELQHMREQLRRWPPRQAKVIGIDEVSQRQGHIYRIIVSDLIRQRPLGYGGKDRTEESSDEFFAWLGPQASGADPAGLEDEREGG